MCVSRHGCRSYHAVRHCFVAHDSKLCISSVRVKFTTRPKRALYPLVFHSVPHLIQSNQSKGQSILLLVPSSLDPKRRTHSFILLRHAHFPSLSATDLAYLSSTRLPLFSTVPAVLAVYPKTPFHRPYGILYCTHVFYFLSASSYCNARIDKIVSLGLLVGYYSCV